MQTKFYTKEHPEHILFFSISNKQEKKQASEYCVGEKSCKEQEEIIITNLYYSNRIKLCKFRLLVLYNPIKLCSRVLFLNKIIRAKNKSYCPPKQATL